MSIPVYEDDWVDHGLNDSLPPPSIMGATANLFRLYFSRTVLIDNLLATFLIAFTVSGDKNQPRQMQMP